MKKTDIAMIVLIASVSILAAYFGTNALLGDITTEEVTVKTAESISSEIPEGQPDPAIFNDDAINPAVEVQVGAAAE